MGHLSRLRGVRGNLSTVHLFAEAGFVFLYSAKWPAPLRASRYLFNEAGECQWRSGLLAFICRFE